MVASGRSLLFILLGELTLPSWADDIGDSCASQSGEEEQCAYSQGWGDVERVADYLTAPDMIRRLEHAGLMDTVFKFELIWTVADRVSISFPSHIRHDTNQTRKA